MRPTFLGFETARKSMNASQKALDITGNNISNVNTKGYSRQRVDLFSMVTPNGGMKYSPSSVTLSGQGVHTGGISQVRDQFLDNRYRDLNADTAYSETRANILLDMEDVFDNFNTDGLLAVMTNFKDALQKFSTDSPDRNELAQTALTSAKQVVMILNSYDTKLNQIQDQTKYEIDITLSDFNATINKIVQLNQQIVESYVGSGSVNADLVGDFTVNTVYGPNELLDTRNVLLDELSTYGNVNVSQNKDGSVKVELDGVTILDGTKAVELSYREDSSTGALSLYYSDGSKFSAQGGSIKAYVDMYNGNGCYATGGQSGVNGIPYYKSMIDKFAETFASAFNEANVDPDNPTQDRTLFASADGMKVNASNIRISEQWLNDATMIIPDGDKGSLDNKHLQKLLSVFNQKFDFGDKGDFNGTFDEYISYYVTKLGQEASFQSSCYKSSFSMQDNIQGARDAVMSVSMDEEGINMMNYQKWFNASARLMTTLDEALNTIINNMGLVGR